MPMQDPMPTDELRAFVWDRCAMPRDRCPLNGRVVGRIEYDDYVLVKLVYDAEPSSSVPAHLYVPRGADLPVPAIILAHGHGGSKSVFFNQYAGQLYAKAGIAVLSTDPLGEEERDAEGRIGTRGHDRCSEEAQSLGRPVMGKMVWDLIRGIDYLETRPEIDAARIGVVGHSLGAIVSMYLAALDDRIKVAVPAAMYFIPPRKQKFCTRGMYELIEERLGYPTLLAMAAGRCATMIPVGDDDPVCGGREVQETGFQEFFGSASALFAQAGAPDGLARHIYPDAGHRAYFLNKEALLWLEQHIDLPRMTADEIRALPEINMSAWAEANGVKFERLYGTEQHYAGHVAPDVGVRYVPPEELACLSAEDRRGAGYTISGWLAQVGSSHAALGASATRIGRPVRVVSISFRDKSLEEVLAVVDQEGLGGADIIALPETWRGQKGPPETLDGPTITAMAQVARNHGTYIVCPIDRQEGDRRLNSAVLLDRDGNVACVYDKVYPYWSEFDLDQPVDVGLEAPVYEADFGTVGLSICFDVNFPEVWQRLADQGAELVIWPSAYSAGTTLQAHALMNHFYIVTSTGRSDCIVYDITGEEILYEKSDGINITRVTLDLDRGIYHQNFNMAKRDKLLKERGEDVAQEKWLEREQWFVLKARRAGVSARELAREYGMEELRDYISRSRRQIDERRGWAFGEKTLPGAK